MWYGYGIDLWSSSDIIVAHNTISGCDYGVQLLNSVNCKIRNNNFIDNIINGFHYRSYLNLWIHNYWERPRIIPKPIYGYRSIFGTISLPCFKYDWWPRIIPYPTDSDIIKN